MPDATKASSRVLFWLLTSFCACHNPGWTGTVETAKVLDTLGGQDAILEDFDDLTRTELAVYYEGLRLMGEVNVEELKTAIEKRHGFRF